MNMGHQHGRKLSFLRNLGLLGAGLALGVGLTFVGLAEAGRLKPADDPQALVAIAQILDAEDKRVDIMLERGDVVGAIAALDQVRGQSWPSRERGGDAAVLLRHDAYGRLLRLRLDHPQVDQQPAERLLDLVDEGLGREWERVDANPFTARLLALRGEVLQDLGRDDEALLSYEQALDMNRELLEEVMGGVGGR